MIRFDEMSSSLCFHSMSLKLVEGSRQVLNESITHYAKIFYIVQAPMPAQHLYSNTFHMWSFRFRHMYQSFLTNEENQGGNPHFELKSIKENEMFAVKKCMFYSLKVFAITFLIQKSQSWCAHFYRLNLTFGYFINLLYCLHYCHSSSHMVSIIIRLFYLWFCPVHIYVRKVKQEEGTIAVPAGETYLWRHLSHLALKVEWSSCSGPKSRPSKCYLRLLLLFPLVHMVLAVVSELLLHCLRCRFG